MRYTAYLSKPAIAMQINVPKLSDNCRFEHCECFCDFRIACLQAATLIALVIQREPAHMTLSCHQVP